MLKKLVLAVAAIGLSGSAQAATYVVLPSPSSLSPPTVIVDGHGSGVFICTSFNEIAAGACRPHRRR